MTPFAENGKRNRAGEGKQKTGRTAAGCVMAEMQGGVADPA
jgi:hypothetical protein